MGMRTGSDSTPGGVISQDWTGHHVLLPVVEAQEILPRKLALSKRRGALEESDVDQSHALGARRLGDLLGHHLPDERNGNAREAVQDLVGAADAGAREHGSLGDRALAGLVLAGLGD